MTPVLPAKQARSRATLERLLQAAAEVLEKEGLEAATLPRIAARARLSPATVYRRFPDKDALLQEVFRRFFEKIYQGNQERFRPELWEGVPLAEMSRRVFAHMIERNREHAGLLLALMRYVAQHPNAGFKRQAQEQQLRSFHNVIRLFLTRQQEIGHPEPALALQLGIMAVSAVMRDLMLIRKAKPEMAQVFPFPDQKIQDELVRMFLSYLQVRQDEPR